MKLGFNILGVCMVVCVSTSQVWAAAFAHDDLTPAGTGVANAIVAGADDISAAIYNPAGLAWQEGVQALLGTQSITRRLSADFGTSSQSGNGNTSGLGVFAMSWMEEGSDWGLSASMATPYSVQTEWLGKFPDTIGETNFIMKRYTLDTFRRINNTLAISAGLDVYEVKTRLNSSGASFSGSDWSKFGVHAGLRWAFKPFWMLGATLRQGADVTSSDGTGASLALTLPNEFTIGLAHDLANDEMRLEMDIKHSQWSSLSALEVKKNGIISQSLATSLKDTTDVSLGLTWFWRENTQFRFGYAYLDRTNALDAYQPAIPDLKGHRLSVGMGGMMSGMHLDLAVSGVIYPAETATGRNAATYSDSLLNWMFTLSKSF